MNNISRHLKHDSLQRTLYKKNHSKAIVENRKKLIPVIFLNIFISMSRKKSWSVVFNHFVCSFYLNLISISVRLQESAKPRHSQSMLIPGRVSTSGCACGGAFVLATKNHEEKKVSTIVTIYQTIKTRKHHTYWAAPRSRERVIFGMWNYPVILSPLFKGELLLFPALRLHLFLFLAAKTREETRRKENSKFKTSTLMSIIPGFLNHTCLLYLIFEENFFKLTLLYRAVSGPGFISLKKYAGLLLRGFLFFLTPKKREGTYSAVKRRRKQGSKKDLRSVVNRWVSRGGSRKRSRRIGNGKGQMVKTLRKNILTSTVKNVSLFLHQRRFKTNYLANKRFSLAVSVNRLYQNTPETKYTGFLHGASFIFVDVIVPVCMTWLPPCKHNSQTFITLPLPILMIHLSLESSPLPLTCNQGAKSVDCRQLALRPAPFSLLYALRPTLKYER